MLNIAERIESLKTTRRLEPVELQADELALLRARRQRNLIEWMENEYYLSGGRAAVEGYWSREYTPFFEQIAEWFSDTTTREIWLQKPAQFGGTTFMAGCLGYVVDCSPGPAMVVMPDKQETQSRIESVIRPMFANNENLLSHIYGKRVENIFITKQTIMNHMNLYIGWPTTAIATGDKPVCYLFLDEAAKFQPVVGVEADPFSLFRKRQLWFRNRSKLLAMSTPVTVGDLFDRNYKRGDCCEFWVPCVHCKKWHLLDRHNIVIDKKTNGKYYREEYYKKGDHYRYVCPKCGVIWTESDRWKSVCSGKFVPDYCQLNDDGKPDTPIRFTTYHSARIHLLMLHTSFDPMRLLVCEYVHAMKQLDAGDTQPWKDFNNSRQALPWKEQKAKGDIDILKKHIGSYEPDIVPVGCQLLVAGIDVQLDHVWLWVLGFGYLSEVWSISNMRIETGPTDRIENLEKLIPYLVRRFEIEGMPKMTMRIALAAIDTQYHTDTVKAFSVRCRGVASVMLVAGDDRLTKQSMRVSKESGGAISVYHLNTCVFKDRLFRIFFESQTPGPGYGHFQKGVDYLLLEHMCAEEKVIERKGERITWIGWKIRKESKPNHYWDCGYYALAAADMAGQWTIASAEELEELRKIEKQKLQGKAIIEKPIRTKY